MSTPRPDASPGTAPSLLGMRIAAALGAVVALVLVVVAFQVALWVGVLALFVSPGVPMLFVLGAEAIRR